MIDKGMVQAFYERYRHDWLVNSLFFIREGIHIYICTENVHVNFYKDVNSFFVSLTYTVNMISNGKQ